jgi:hypothetical protein
MPNRPTENPQSGRTGLIRFGRLFQGMILSGGDCHARARSLSRMRGFRSLIIQPALCQRLIIKYPATARIATISTPSTILKNHFNPVFIMYLHTYIFIAVMISLLYEEIVEIVCRPVKNRDKKTLIKLLCILHIFSAFLFILGERYEASQRREMILMGNQEARLCLGND